MRNKKLTAIACAAALLASLSFPQSRMTQTKASEIRNDVYSATTDYSNSLSDLVFYGDNDTVVIPSGSEVNNTVSFSSFGEENSSSIENVIFPSEYKQIKTAAFYRNADNIKNVLLPDSLEDAETLLFRNDVVLIGKQYSYAHYVAQKNGNTFRISGDLNGDDTVDASDILIAVSYMMGYTDISTTSSLAADFTHDGKVNLSDLIMLKNYVIYPDDEFITAADCVAAPDLRSRMSKSIPVDNEEFRQFAADFSDIVLTKTEDTKGSVNHVYSPLSAYMAMSVAAECTTGKTQEEILDVLKVSDTDELAVLNKKMFDSLYFNNFRSFCRISNSLWLNRGKYSFNDELLRRLSDYYYAASFTKDLGNKDDCDDISEWIYLNTSGKFKPEIQPDADAIVRLINTVAFKELWTDSFDSAKSKPFTLASGDTVNADFMFCSDSTGSIVNDSDYIKTYKNMNNGFRMNFVLPGEGYTPEDLISDKEIMNRIFSSDENYEKGCVRFNIPKFSASSKYDFKEAFGTAGIKQLFISGDMSPLVNTDNPTVIADAAHEAIVEIDENGCTAAAYTMMVGKATSAVTKIFDFNADRPFIYYISDATNTPLFVGIVNDPTAK